VLNNQKLNKTIIRIAMPFFQRKTEQNTQFNTLNQQLKEHQQTLNALSRVWPNIEFDPQGHILTANSSFLNLMGYELSEVTNQHHRIFCDTATTSSQEYQQFWQKLARGEAAEGRFLRITKSGKEVWLEARYCPVLDENQRVTKVIKLASDISDTVNNLHAIDSQIAAANRSMAVIQFDLSGSITQANDNFLRAMGYRMNELTGKHHRIFCTQDYSSSSDYKSFWDHLKAGEFFQGKVERVAKNGDTVWLEATYNPIFDKQGTLVQFIKFATDITASVKATARTTDMAYEASKKTENISKRGEHVVHKAIQAMDEVSKELTSAGQKIDSLSQQSEQISNIVSTISSIAEQTNLLALNAAIEAARAGDQGRGFAVVADEVRQLAGRTSTSTSEIDEVVKHNNSLASEAVSAMQQIDTLASTVNDLITETGHAIAQIGTNTNELVEVVSQLSSETKK
jgi:methyl-accepting chemotaxis protein